MIGVYLYLGLAFVLCATALATVRAASLIRAAITLTLGNSALAALFFLLGAPLAGGVQLSVGSGLISVLFIIAISLTEIMRSTDEA